MWGFQPLPESPEEAQRQRELNDQFDKKNSIDISEDKKWIRDALYWWEFNPKNQEQLSEQQVQNLEQDYLETKNDLQDTNKREKASKDLWISLDVNSSEWFHELIIRTVSQEAWIELHKVRKALPNLGWKEEEMQSKRPLDSVWENQADILWNQEKQTINIEPELKEKQTEETEFSSENIAEIQESQQTWELLTEEVTNENVQAVENNEESNKTEEVEGYNSVEKAPESTKWVVSSITSKVKNIIESTENKWEKVIKISSQEKPNIKSKNQEDKEINNTSTAQEKIISSIQNQSEKPLDSKVALEKLTNTQNRTNNIEQAKDLLFSEPQVKQYANWNEKLAQFGEQVFEWWNVHEELAEVLANFVILSDAKTPSDVESTQINEALNNAFNLEIAKEVEWKVNYKEETVSKMRSEILSNDTNPLEKFQKFLELRAEVQKSVWAIAKKTEKLKKSTSTAAQKKEALQKRANELQAEAQDKENPVTQERKKAIRQELVELKKQYAEVGKWEVITWGEKDVVSDKIQENGDVA